MGVVSNLALLFIPGTAFTKFGKAGDAAKLSGNIAKVEKGAEVSKNIEKGTKTLEDAQKAAKAAEAEKAAKAAEKAKIVEGKIKALTVSRKLQKTIIDTVENGKVKLETTLQKGNYGEMKMDDYYETHGYERISSDRVTNLNQASHQGIDGVYCNPGPPPKYVIGEAKYGSSQLSILADGTKQMSDVWIDNGLDSSRLKSAVGREYYNKIVINGYDKTLVHVDVKGTIDITEIN